MFNENWFSESQQKDLIETVKKVKSLKGRFIEIGCWEGRSTVAIANECFPENLDAVDNWTGSFDESPTHESVMLASKRDVFATFKDNIGSMTKGNVTPYKKDCFEYLKTLKGPVKFCNIDASHDYNSVKKTIEMLLPKLSDGAILCGDDYYNANINRKDLSGGVQRAVIEMCPIHSHRCNFWIYRHSAINRLLLKLAPARMVISSIRKCAYKIRCYLHSLRRAVKQASSKKR